MFTTLNLCLTTDFIAHIINKKSRKKLPLCEDISSKSDDSISGFWKRRTVIVLRVIIEDISSNVAVVAVEFRVVGFIERRATTLRWWWQWSRGWVAVKTNTTHNHHEQTLDPSPMFLLQTDIKSSTFEDFNLWDYLFLISCR